MSRGCRRKIIVISSEDECVRKSENGCLICYSDDIPSKIFIGEEDSLRSSSLSEEITICGNCEVEIERAKQIYEGLVEALRQFRNIQVRCLNSVKQGIGGEGGSAATYHGGKENIWRRTLTNRCRDFVIKNLDDQLEKYMLGKDIPDLETLRTTENSEVNSPGWSVKDEVETAEPGNKGLGSKDAGLYSEYSSGGEDASAKIASSNSPTECVDVLGDGDEIELKMEIESDDQQEDEDVDNSLEDNDNSCSDSNLERKDVASDNEENNKNKEVRCEICYLYCKSKTGLTNHMWRTHPHKLQPRTRKPGSKLFDKSVVKDPHKYPHKCPVENCGRVFRIHRLLRNHITKHSKLPEFKCEICTKEFYTQADVRKHVQKIHPETLPPKPQQTFPCDLCSKVCRNRNGLTRHKSDVHNIQKPKMCLCPIEGCGQSFRRMENLKIHLSRSHGQEPAYKCTNCQKAFHSYKTKWRHEAIEHQEGRSKRPFICDTCGKTFMCTEHLTTHVYNTHTSKLKPKPAPPCKQPKVCELCGKILKSALNLKTHKIQIHQKDKLKYPCHLCDKRYIQVSQLNQHLFHCHDVGPEQHRRIVRRGKCFQCPVSRCRQRYYGNEAERTLKTHMIQVHGEDGKKPGEHKCKFCGKDFFIKGKLTVHEMAHENMESKPFICDICQKGFSTNYNLHFHRRYTHKVTDADKRVTKFKFRNQEMKEPVTVNDCRMTT